MQDITTHFLDMVESPKDIKVLNSQQLKLLAGEIRHKIITTTANTGGHLAPSLGVVELSIALHYTFNCPDDKIVWDVGHQSYPHKLLTGRAKRFNTLRQYKGISGFPKIKESKFDAFGTGHSSTAISAALGIAKARDLKKSSHKVIAVVGDGALTGGMAFEGLNQAGHLKSNLIVVLNDNKMSISPNVGALSSYLGKMITHPKYKQTRKKIELFLKKLSKKAAEKASSLEDSIRAMSGPGLLFKEMGFKYFGPVNGHDLDSLIRLFHNIKDIKGPILVHLITKKGKGYAYAEEEVVKFHGISKFNIDNGKKITSPSNITYTHAFSKALLKLAKEDPKILAITAAMAPGTGLEKFKENFPDRFFDVGIAEQHAVTFAGGLASNGFKPVVAIYSTFLQRAYDQIVHDICLQNLPVVFAVDRAGLVGEDGPTHHGILDLSFLRTIPNITIMAPKDENELGHMLKTAIDMNSPVAIRYPRGSGIGIEIQNHYKNIETTAEILKQGKDVLIIAAGPLVYEALAAADELEKKNISVCVLNPRFIKPLDEKTILNLARKTKKIITIEENTLEGGFGSAVLELLEKNNIRSNIKRMGIPDSFIEHGATSILKEQVGLTKKHIIQAIKGM
jgi:1-deoxy-D-xylulose-5-phosphate synthase